MVSSGSAFIIKRSSYTKSNTEGSNLEGDALDKEESGNANLLTPVEGYRVPVFDLPIIIAMLAWLSKKIANRETVAE